MSMFGWKPIGFASTHRRRSWSGSAHVSNWRRSLRPTYSCCQQTYKWCRPCAILASWLTVDWRWQTMSPPSVGQRIISCVSCSRWRRRQPWCSSTLDSTRLDYCNSVLYGIADNQLQWLQSVQNAAARLVTGTWTEHIAPVLQSLHWLQQAVDYLQTCNTGA